MQLVSLCWFTAALTACHWQRAGVVHVRAREFIPAEQQQHYTSRESGDHLVDVTLTAATHDDQVQHGTKSSKGHKGGHSSQKAASEAARLRATAKALLQQSKGKRKGSVAEKKALARKVLSRLLPGGAASTAAVRKSKVHGAKQNREVNKKYKKRSGRAEKVRTKIVKAEQAPTAASITTPAAQAEAIPPNSKVERRTNTRNSGSGADDVLEELERRTKEKQSSTSRRKQEKVEKRRPQTPAGAVRRGVDAEAVPPGVDASSSPRTKRPAQKRRSHAASSSTAETQRTGSTASTETVRSAAAKKKREGKKTQEGTNPRLDDNAGRRPHCPVVRPPPATRARGCRSCCFNFLR
mmetsp:Transcript_9209/g.22589  ORF Transcript_9209/g.22589 Transcript_9209/m.22589 type:complete len:352 (+) Transcript_9209:139-1194(+)